MLASTTCSSALAQEDSDLHPWLTEDFSVDVGIFFPDREVEIRVDGSLAIVERERDIDFTLIRTFFGRNLDSADHHDFGVGIGLHYLEIGAFIEGNATVNGQPAGFRRETATAAAPLPNIGAWYVRSLSERWAFRARLDWLSADVGDYDGTLINAALGFNFQLFEHAGLGVSYNLFLLDVGVDDDGWRGEVKTSYEGLFVHASAYW